MDAQELTMIATQLKQAFDPEVLTHLGRETGFTERLRRVTPQRLGLALLTACAAQKVETLADLQRAFNALNDTTVSYKPFYGQLAKPAFPVWMEAVVQQLLAHLVRETLTPLPDRCLAAFTALQIQDSTGLKVHPALRPQFPGRYPVKAPAVAELHVTFSLTHDQAVRIALTSQRADPRAHLPAPTTLAGSLILTDRGYQSAEYGRQVDAAGGFVIMRCTQKVNPQLRACWLGGQRRPEWDGKRLAELLPHLTGQDADLDVEWHPGRGRPQRVRLRLVLLWNPQKRQHCYLVTNLDRERFPAAVVGQLYRLRWQIELLFKEWKSYSNLHRFDTQNAAITTGLIWAALAAALLKRFLAQAAQASFAAGTVSTRKAAMALAPYLPRLGRQLLQGGDRGLRTVLRELLAFLHVNAQRSNPTREAQQGRSSFGLQPAHV